MIKKLALFVMLSPMAAYATCGPNHDQPCSTPTPTTNIRIDNDAYSRSQANAKSIANAGAVSGSFSGANAQGGAASANGGDSSARSGANSGGNTLSTSYNQVRQTPFAYSPGLAASFSQDNCANSASLGVSAGFGAIGGGAPVESDACNRRKDVALWLATGQNRIACERMTDDEANSDAMKRAGLDCSKLTAQPVAAVVSQPVRASNVPNDDQWAKMDMQRDIMINQVMAKRHNKQRLNNIRNLVKKVK